MLFRNKTLLAKIESPYGTDAVPTGTDAILTSNLRIQPYTGQTVSRDNDRSNLGGQSVININPNAIVEFDVELAGAGTAGNAPAWAPLLLACGFAESDSSPTGTSKIYNLISTAFPGITLYFYHDGQRHKIIGGRGDMSCSLTRGEIPKMSFIFTGQYETPTAATPSGADVSDFISPIAVTNTNTPTFTMGGSPLVDLRAESFNFALNNQVVPRNIINANEISITDRGVTGGTVFEAVLPSTKDWFTDAFESDSGVNLQAINLVHGTVAGNILEFSAPAVQATLNGQNDSEGIIVYDTGLNFTPVSGNDEITITVR